MIPVINVRSVSKKLTSIKVNIIHISQSTYSMAGSGPTVDVSLIDEEYEDTDGLAEAMDAWGRLFSLGKGLKGIGKS